MIASRARVLVVVLSGLALASREAPARTLRVGLVDGAAEVVVGAAGQDLMLTAVGAPVGDRARWGPLRFGLRDAAAPAPAAEPPAAPAATAPEPGWNVLVRGEATRRKAEQVRDALAGGLRAPLRVDRRGSEWAVVAGPFDQESRARAVLSELEAAGMAEARLIRPEARAAAPEQPAAAVDSRLVAVTGLFVVLAIPGESARVSAPDGAPILVDGKPHRGEIDVSVGAGGRLTAVAIVELEDYVRGVVPGEMGPEAYPALEALKAQAIAARTYAFMPPAHAAEGFDRCAGPHCQVYGGIAVEHPLADQAVRETSGLVLTHAGELAHAYFSSTCGGHTEDVTNVFDDEPQPYLRGVPCYPERVDFVRLPGRLLPVDWQRADGTTAHDVIARMVAVDVITADEAAAGLFSRRARADESAEWLRRAARAAGRTIDETAMPALDTESAIGLVRGLVTALGIGSQERLVRAQDLAAAARFRDLQGLSGDDLQAALLALKAGLLPDGLEPGWTASRLSRGNVLEFLERYLRTDGVLDGRTVRFVGARERSMLVLEGREVVALGVAPDVLLLSRRKEGRPRLREALEIKLGDKLRVLTSPEGEVRYVELEEDPDGAAFDRLSPYSWWTRHVTRAQLQEKASARGIADVRGVRVTRVSAAGRVVGLELEDGAGRAHLVERFEVRQLLGLPDSRADLHVERTADGELAGITATGRGWGHGVGMCQVGAFGMALGGRSAAEILAHYYPGTQLQSAASFAP